MELLIAICIILVSLFIIAFPVKLAANFMGAKRSGTLWCLISLAGASILHGVGMLAPVFGSIVAFLLSGVAFAAILGTGFIRGLGIAVLQIIFSAIIIFILTIVFGVSVAGLFAMLGGIMA